uniref:Transposase n=1 Tax=Gongylonema pulchrum TaxID=637853 RepID=A0A183EUF0_9BILA
LFPLHHNVQLHDRQRCDKPEHGQQRFQVQEQ